MSTSNDGSWALAWWVERVGRAGHLLVPLSIGVGLIGGTERLGSRSLVALWMIMTLRLLDDLQDLAHDRLVSPERVLCQQRSLRGPRRVLGLGLGLGALLLFGMGASPSLLLVLGAVLGGAGWARPRWPAARAVWAHLVLLKVPLLGLMLAPGLDPEAVSRAILAFGLVGGYELAHDQALRRSAWAAPLLVLDLLCLGIGAWGWLG